MTLSGLTKFHKQLIRHVVLIPLLVDDPLWEYGYWCRYWYYYAS